MNIEQWRDLINADEQLNSLTVSQMLDDWEAQLNQALEIIAKQHQINVLQAAGLTKMVHILNAAKGVVDVYENSQDEAEYKSMLAEVISFLKAEIARTESNDQQSAE